MLFEHIGWIGSFLLAACGAPLAIEAYKKKRSDINIWFLLSWYVGELFMLAYALKFKSGQLNFNYIANIIFISIVLYYKIRPGKND